MGPRWYLTVTVLRGVSFWDGNRQHRGERLFSIPERGLEDGPSQTWALSPYPMQARKQARWRGDSDNGVARERRGWVLWGPSQTLRKQASKMEM